MQEFAARAAGFVPEGSLVRVKLWDADGRIVYSDEPRLIGEQFALGNRTSSAALNVRGDIDPEVSDLEKAENQFESEFGRLLEVYVGVESTDGQPLLFEAYFLYDAVVDAGRRDLATVRARPRSARWSCSSWCRSRSPGSSRGGSARQQQERERLLRYAVESSDAERRRIAGDLHDGVIQDLTGLTFALDATRLGNATEEDRSRLIADGATRLREQHLGAADADGGPLPAQPGHDGAGRRTARAGREPRAARHHRRAGPAADRRA